METALIKLGGSVVTVKGRLMTFSMKNVVDLSAELKRYISSNRGKRIVLVHGGGSFGHIKAKKYMLKEGLRESGQLKGFAEVRRDMRLLNGKILDCLLSAGINAIALPAESIVSISDMGVEHADFSLVDRALDNGLVPITFGDAVFDRKRGFTIVSGDLLMRSLCEHLKPSVSVFCTDVDGVYDRNPSLHRDALLIGRLSESMRVASENSARADVTGEMSGKLAVLFAIARNSSRTYVVNGKVKGRLTSALAGEGTIGTRVVAD